MDRGTANVSLTLAQYLFSDQRLRGLSVVASEAWVAPGRERQQDVAVGSPGGAEDAPAADEGAQAVPAPAQAPQPPPPLVQKVDLATSKICVDIHIVTHAILDVCDKRSRDRRVFMVIFFS
nr:hypothetical protein [Tanacetum cinerariifolium]